jgi:acid phosphatase type 7
MDALRYRVMRHEDRLRALAVPGAACLVLAVLAMRPVGAANPPVAAAAATSAVQTTGAATVSGASAAGSGPPHFDVPAPAGRPLTFIAYGDTRFTPRSGDITNPYARRALVEKMAGENPTAILIGGDLVYEGADPQDYAVYRSETTVWSERRIAVFPALGNHEFKGCTRENVLPCLENWWAAFSALSLKPYRWYSVTIGPSILALILDSDSHLKPGSEQRVWFEHEITGADSQIKFILVVLHYPPVRDPVYPRTLDEKEVARYLKHEARSLRAQVVVIGSHVHNYERYFRDGVTYLVSGGGGAKPVPALRLFGERSKLKTSVNYHYLRFVLDGDRLIGTMVRFDAAVDKSNDPWSEPDRFEVRAKDQPTAARMRREVRYAAHAR